MERHGGINEWVRRNGLSGDLGWVGIALDWMDGDGWVDGWIWLRVDRRMDGKGVEWRKLGSTSTEIPEKNAREDADAGSRPRSDSSQHPLITVHKPHPSPED